MRHVACLSFDFDTLWGQIASGRTTPTPISRGEFGVVASARILELLRRFEIRATWFIPGLTIETYPDACKRIARHGHEIAHHGWRHVAPAKLSRREEETELIRGNEAIRQVSGRNARGYRSPTWDLSPHTIDLLVEHGFFYESSLMGHDHEPYRARSGDVIKEDAPPVFGPETSLVEMPISWTLDDYPHFEMGSHGGLQPAAGVLENWVDDFLYMTRTTDRGILTYTCHPFVIGRGHRMLMLERLIQKLLELGAAFLPMEEAAKELAERDAASGSPSS